MRPSSNFEATGIGLTNPNASTAVDDESVAMCVSSLKVVSTPIVTTSNVVTLTVEKSNDGFQMVGKKKKSKGKSNSTNGGQFVGPLVKPNVRYEPTVTTSILGS
ncbi:hypothetical protein Tco_0566560 [Tanacetum coccineum]